MRSFDVVVISDLHLGARNTRTVELLRFLSWVRTDQLVVAGDIFDSKSLRGLSSEHVAVLDALRDLGRKIEVIWLGGNHDPDAQWFRAVLGIECREELLLDVGSGTYMVYHGHGWDPSLDWSNLLVGAADACYRLAQRMDPSHALARRLKHGSKHFCATVNTVRREAVQTAREMGLSGVILGHTHVPADHYEDGVHYLNSGCWTEKPSSFVGVRGSVARRYCWDTLKVEGAPAGLARQRLSQSGIHAAVTPRGIAVAV